VIKQAPLIQTHCKINGLQSDECRGTLGRRKARKAWLACLALCAAGAAGAAAAADRVYISDVYEIATVADPQIARDASRVAYIREAADAATDSRYSTVRVVDLRTGEDTAITTGSRADNLPRWSPSGRTLVYQRASKDGYELVLHAFGAAPERVLYTTDAPLVAVAWSPDGQRLAGVRQVAVHQQVELPTPPGATRHAPARLSTRLDFQGPADPFLRPTGLEAVLIDATGAGSAARKPIPFSSDAFHPRGAAISWSKDGTALLVSASPQPDFWRNLWKYRLYEIRVDSGEIRPLTADNGSDFGVTESPDGSHLAYISDPQRIDQWYFRMDLTISDRNGNTPRSLSGKLDRPFRHVAWVDSQNLVASFVDRGVAKIGAFSIDGVYRPLTDQLASRATAYSEGGSFSVAGDGTVAYTASTDTDPSEIAVVRAGSAPRIVTKLNAGYEAARRFGAVSPFSFKAPDGVNVDGWVVRPPDFVKGHRYPLIVMLHGGVSSDYGPRFDISFQTLAAHGFIVAYPNYRGSGSYGADFSNLANGQFPRGVETDVIAALDAMIATGDVETQQVYVMGGSAGGTLTAWTIGRTNRFAGAAVLYPVIDWGTYYLTSISYMRPFLFAKPVWEDPADYTSRSPLMLAGNVTTPTATLVGDLDRITPPDQAVAFYAALKRRGVDAEIVTFPEEPHGLDRYPSHEAQVSVAVMEWFRSHGAKVEAPRYPASIRAPVAPAN
jgi:dipeptidyl aminopeptidase/acylaminoacyl peptidase